MVIIIPTIFTLRVIEQNQNEIKEQKIILF